MSESGPGGRGKMNPWCPRGYDTPTIKIRWMVQDRSDRQGDGMIMMMVGRSNSSTRRSWKGRKKCLDALRESGLLEDG